MARRAARCERNVPRYSSERFRATQQLAMIPASRPPHTPGNNTAETALARLGDRIRTWEEALITRH
jgi:hypothetical protein